MGIPQAGILEWVAMPSARGSTQLKDRALVSHIAGGLFTVWASREAQGELPNPGTEPGSPALQADSLPAELSSAMAYSPWEGSHVSILEDDS